MAIMKILLNDREEEFGKEKMSVSEMLLLEKILIQDENY